MASASEVLTNDALTDEAVLRISQDYVREVVAHEVGHVLGLRHNFAGSLDGTLSRKELNDWFKAYVTGKSTDAYTNKITANSVMDYNILQSAVFIGWRMRTLKEPLPHDRAAIGWGYFDSSEARDKKMMFGTDEDSGRYGDVRRFDYGPDPVVNAYADMAEAIDLLPNTIIETFIRARTPLNTNDRVPLEKVNLNSAAFARQLSFQFADMLSWFRKDTRSFRIENQFDFVGDLNQKERYQAHWKYLNTQLTQLSGVDRAAFSFLPLDLKLDLKQEPTNVPVVPRLNTTNLTARLEKLLASSNYSTFVGLDDKKTNFTKEEHDLIIQRGKKFLSSNSKKKPSSRSGLRLEDAPRTLGVEATGAVSEDDAVSKLEQRIIELAKIVVTAKDETNKLSGKLDAGRVEVAEFKYDQETRLAAAKALNERTGSFKGWAEDAKSGILNGDLKKDVEASLLIDPSQRLQSLPTLPPPARMVSATTRHSRLAPRRPQINPEPSLAMKKDAKNASHVTHPSHASHSSHAPERLLPPRGDYQTLLSSPKPRRTTTSLSASPTNTSPRETALWIR